MKCRMYFQNEPSRYEKEKNKEEEFLVQNLAKL